MHVVWETYMKNQNMSIKRTLKAQYNLGWMIWMPRAWAFLDNH